MATFILSAGSNHPQAFVTQTGIGGQFSLKFGKNWDCSSLLIGSLGHSDSPFAYCSSMLERLSSLQLAQPSDIEVQPPYAQSEVEDEDEWRTVIASFQMYKAAYGDLKVPSRFIVPGIAPWPGEIIE